MKSLNGRALIALVSGSLAIAAACSSPKRNFDGASGGGNGSGDAGDSTVPGDGVLNHAGNAGASSHAGTANNGGTPPGGGDAGVGATSIAGAGGDSGAAGAPGTPECGAPGTACCDGDVCVAHAACSAATCKCTTNFSVCSEACVDLKGDPKNCGACGHGCLGGVCDTGTCQPVNVVTGQQGMNEMVTDGTNLYWTGHGTPSSNPPTVYYVARRRVDASDAVKVLAPSEVGGTSLALAGDKVYWIADQQLRSCDLPACTNGPQNVMAGTIHSSQGYDLLFEPTKKGLYISSYSDYNATNGAVTLLASGSTTPVVVGPSPIGASTLVKDASNVYWLASATYTMDNLNANGGIYRQRVSDGTVTQLVPNFRGELSNLAVGGNALFFQGNLFTPAQMQAIIRAPLPNGLASGSLPKFVDATIVYGMVADDAYLYYAQGSSSTGTISRCPVAACPSPEVIVPGILYPTMGPDDAVSIYWKSTTYLANGATSVDVQRLAK